MKTKRLFTVLAVLGVLIAIGFWLAHLIRSTPDRIQVGYMNIVAHLPLVAAAQEDVFSEFLLDVELEQFADTPTLMQALVDERIDVAFQVTPDIAWQAAARGSDYYVYFVAQSTMEAPIDGLYALQPMNADLLRDAQIGVFPGPTASAMMKEIMREAYELSVDDYTLRPIPPPLQLSLLGNGEVAALFTYEPLGTLAVERGGAHRILSGPVERFVVNPWNGGVGVFGANLVNYRPTVACNFAAAIAASVELLEENPDLAASLMSELQPGLSPEIAAKVPLTEYYFTRNGEIPAARTLSPTEINRLLQDQLATYVTLGILDEGGRLPVLEACDN